MRTECTANSAGIRTRKRARHALFAKRCDSFVGAARRRDELVGSRFRAFASGWFPKLGRRFLFSGARPAAQAANPRAACAFAGEEIVTKRHLRQGEAGLGGQSRQSRNNESSSLLRRAMSEL